MTASRDPDRLIHAFLLEGAEKLPDQVYDAVRAEIEQKRQRVVIGPWRMPALNKLVPIGLVTVAVLAVLVVGSQLFGSPTASVGGPGVGPTPTPQPSVAAPSAEPSASAAADRSLPEGAFVFSDGEFGGVRSVAITVTIPARGWYGEPGGGILENSSGEQDFGPGDAAIIGPFVEDIYVPRDPCRWTTTLPETPATTVDEVVAALQGQASRDPSEPRDITVDGHAGKSITLRVPDDAAFAQCDRSAGEPEGRFCTLSGEGGDPERCQRYHQFPGQIDELWILDVDGDVAVIDAMWSDTTAAEPRAEMQAMLESMTFE